MKKLFSLIAMAVMCAGFVSCSDDDDNNDPVIETPVFSSVKANYSIKLDETTLKLADVMVVFTNADGEVNKHTVFKPEWEMSITTKTPITECGVELYFRKQLIDYSDSNPIFSTADDGSKYANIGYDEIKVHVETLDQNGNIIRESNLTNSPLRFNMAPEKFLEFFEANASTPYSTCVALIDKNGEISEKPKQ